MEERQLPKRDHGKVQLFEDVFMQPIPDPPTAESGAQSNDDGCYVSQIPPGIQRSNEAFRRDLPALLQNKKLFRQWVAYHGEERIGIARSEFDLFDECFRRGLKQEEFVVCCIVPEMPRDLDVTPYFED